MKPTTRPNLLSLGLFLLLAQISFAKGPTVISESTYFAQAIRLQEQGDFVKSRKILEWLVRRNPKKGLYHFNLGNVRFTLRDYPKSILSYRKVIQLKSPLAPAASLYLARSFRLSGKPGLALDELRAVRKLSLPPSLQAEIGIETEEIMKSFLAIGMSRFEKGDFPGSIRSFDLVITLSPGGESKDRAILMKGIALYQLNDPEEAQVQFEFLSRNSSNPFLRENASSLNRELGIAGYFGQFPWWSFLDVSAGYNTNVNENPLSLDWRGSSLVRTQAGLGSRLFKRGEFTGSAALSINVDQFFEVPESRLIQTGLTLPFTIENSQVWKNLTLFGSHGIFGSIPETFRPGASLGFGKKRSGHEWGVSYTFIDKIPLSDEFSFSKGLIHEVRGFYSVLGRNQYWIASLTAGKEDALDQQITGVIIPLARTYLLPALSFKEQVKRQKTTPWEWGAEASYGFSFFDQGRQDRLLTLGVFGGKWINKSIKIYSELTFTENQSTLNADAILNRNFKAWVANLGVSWDIHR